MRWINKRKFSLHWTRLPCHSFAANRVRLRWFALAYALGNFLRRLELPRPISRWLYRTLQTRLIRIGAKLARHPRYIRLRMAEASILRNLFAAILRRIRRLIQPVPVWRPSFRLKLKTGFENVRGAVLLHHYPLKDRFISPRGAKKGGEQPV